MAVSRRTLLQLAMAPAVLAQTRATAQDLDPTVSRVYPGPSGRLVYVPDEQGNTIHDASHAGYRGGGVAIPTAPVRETIWPVAGDNTEHIQAAIDKVSARPLDAGGFRGTVLLRAGYYRVVGPLRIKASGVVLRGEGMGDTGTILIATGTGRPAAPAGGAAAVPAGAAPAAPAAPPAGAAAGAPPGAGPGGAGRGGPPVAGGRGGAPAAGGRGGAPGGGGPGGGQPTLIRVAGASGVTMKDETKQLVTDEYVPVGARSFKVVSARGFKA